MTRAGQITKLVQKRETALSTLLETIENRRKLLKELQEEYTELLWQKAALLHEIYLANEELSECESDSGSGRPAVTAID